MRYRAEPPRPIQTNTPAPSDGRPGWVKWLIGGVVVVVLLLAAMLAMAGGDNPDPVKRQAAAPAAVKPVVKPNSWKRSYDTAFKFASNPGGGQPVVVSSVNVVGLNRSRVKIAYQVNSACSASFAEKRRWELLAYLPGKVGKHTPPDQISKKLVFGSTCQWTVVFNYPASWIIAPRSTELWIQIPQGRGPSNPVAVGLSVPASHRGV